MEKWEKDYFKLINDEKELNELIEKVNKEVPSKARFMKKKELWEKIYQVQHQQNKLLLENAESVDFYVNGFTY